MRKDSPLACALVALLVTRWSLPATCTATPRSLRCRSSAILQATTVSFTTIFFPLLAWSSASILRDAGMNVWSSAAVWMYPGWIMSMTRDCAEILEVSLLMPTVLAVRRVRTGFSRSGRLKPALHFLAAILATCAVLTKETALLAIGVMG